MSLAAHHRLTTSRFIRSCESYRNYRSNGDTRVAWRVTV